MKRKELIRICQQYNEYCQGCPFVNQHGACTVGQPWKQNSIHLVGRKENKRDDRSI